MSRKQSSGAVIVRIKFVDNDLHLSAAKGSKLEFTSVGKSKSMDSLIVLDGNLVICNFR